MGLGAWFKKMASQFVPGQAFQPGAAAVPPTKVEISVTCRNLLDRDVMSKSDPICVLYVTRRGGSRDYYEFGRTEMIKNTLNPIFVKKFEIDYFFEELQRLKFDVYDVDSPSQKLSKHDFLGTMECTLGEILGSTSSKLEKPLGGVSGKKNCGIISVMAEEISSCKDIVTLKFNGTKLDKKDFFGKSDPFLVFYRCNEDNSFTIVHKTEVIKKTLNPMWQPFTVMVRSLCNGDYDRVIKIECYDWDSDGGHDFIGEFTTNLRELSKGPGTTNINDLINPKKKNKKKNYKNSGTIELVSFHVEKQHTFLDYIKGGTQLNFTVAIDFTASNGAPSQPASLHYINPYQPNQYSTALRAVGEIIQDYDTDKLFPAMGFGARIPPTGEVSHEFPLNFNPNNPFCPGLDGILAAYENCLRQVQLYGPTNFAPIINHVARFAHAYQDGSNYFVLLMLTDGIISDMERTKAAIVGASLLPMSIIIIGVGQAEFDAMEELDADNKRLSSGGKYADRDIVQFVPLRNFLDLTRPGANVGSSQAQLAKEVLAELPDQLVLYMKKRGFKPNAQPAQQHSSLSPQQFAPGAQAPSAPSFQ